MLRRITILSIIFVALTACRVNNGDIGDYFGSWHLENMTIDGSVPEDFDPEATFWEFQNNIIRVLRVEFMYSYNNSWGTWSESNGQLILDFNHYSSTDEPGTGIYASPTWIGFPSGELIRLKFISRNSHRMTLQWPDPDGRIYTYSLRKIW